MSSYLIRRIWQMIPTLLGVILLVFVLFHVFGGDPAEIIAGQNASAQQVDVIRQQLGLNQPWWIQLWIFFREVVTFHWGDSWATREPVAHIFFTRLPATLTIMVPLFVMTLVLSVPIALGVAYVRGSLTDRLTMLVTTMALSISFLVYIIAGQWLFGFEFNWFPIQGWSPSLLTNLAVYVPLPVLLAVLVSLSPQVRLYRTFFLDEIGQDYVRTARAKGLTEGRVVFRHVLRNALIPILTDISLQLPGLFVGSFLIEVFFSIPGLGREVLLAVNRSDYPVIQATTIYLAVFTMLINLVTDILYRVVDPRVVLK
ncbi:MAG TPA: ABC transporter permease [Steroidobacteraceae bacterium]|nr:ABC transporter permease [Steroidobacteraceae bacterium]